MEKNVTYILSCADGSLYTGWTNHLAERVKAHNRGEGAKYTKPRRPVQLAYYEIWDTKQEAMHREWEIKQLTHREKQRLIAAGQPDAAGIPCRCLRAGLETRELSFGELSEIYADRMQEDFPAAELKPLSAMERMMKAGHYRPWGFYEVGTLVAYACLVVCEDCPCALLDYFAVAAERRGTGVGSRCLSVLRELMEGIRVIYIESERRDEARSEGDRSIRVRRQDFYLRAGARRTELTPRIYGVGYRLFALPCNEDDKGLPVQENLEALYHVMFPEERYAGIVRWR